MAPEHTQPFRDFVIHTFTTRNATVPQVPSKLIGRRSARSLLGQVDVNPIAPSRMPPFLWLGLFHAVLARAPQELSCALLIRSTGSVPNGDDYPNCIRHAARVFALHPGRRRIVLTHASLSFRTTDRACERG